RNAFHALVRGFGAPLVHDASADLRERYAESPRVLEWLTQVEEALLESLESVAANPDAWTEADADRAPNVLDACRVNLVVDNTGIQRPPIVIESAPTLRNLFGGADRTVDRPGALRLDHMQIRAGSILRANGGYLVFNLTDAAAHASVWPMLKRALRNMKADIPSFDVMTGQPVGGVQPQPHPPQLKVIVLGDNETYQMLYDHDDDFRSVFKVKADFDSTMRRSAAAVRDYASLVAGIVRDENLLAFDATAVAGILEAGARIAGRQT